MKPFLIPGYVYYYEKDNDIFVTSKLHQDIVKLNVPEIKTEFINLYKNKETCTLSTPLTELLHQEGFLLTKEELNAAMKKLYQQLEGILAATIMPTEGCNFRCLYCYESHTPVSMTRRTLDQIQNYLLVQIPKFKRINISWFGGEPTLCKDVVLETNDMIKKQCGVYGNIFTSSMTTNGYLLDLNNFKEYLDCGITEYQITLDGRKHDHTRPHVLGSGTLQKILENLDAISALPQEQYQFKIILRHNLMPDDIDYTWYDDLYKRFKGDERFCVFFHSIDDWGGENVSSLHLLSDNEKAELIKKHINYVKSIGMPCENEKSGPFSKICYASYPHSMVFRSKGQIEKCTVCLGHPENLIGSVTEDGVIIDDSANAKWGFSDLKQECCSCKNLSDCLNLPCKRKTLVEKNNDLHCHQKIYNLY